MLNLIGFWLNVSVATILIVLPVYLLAEVLVCCEISRLTDKRCQPEAPVFKFVFEKIVEPTEGFGIFLFFGNIGLTFLSIIALVNDDLIRAVSEWSQAFAPFTWWLIVPFGYALIANRIIKPLILKMFNISDKINKL